MKGMTTDIRYAVRNLARHRGFVALSVITLALGIGGTSAIFSTVNALLLKPFEFPNLERVVTVWETQRDSKRLEASMANYLDWREQNQTFEHLACYRSWNANITGGDAPERIEGYQVSTNLLNVTGVKPLIGRGFAPDEDQPDKPPVAVLSYGFWQRRFSGDIGILNKEITINGINHTVIGVMPQNFSYPSGTDVLAPLTAASDVIANRQTRNYVVIGRLRAGVKVEQAQADLDMIAKRLEEDYPQTNSGWSVGVYPIAQDSVRMYSTALWVMFGAVAFVLLIACANVANLTLARATSRQKEITLRSALGASRARIVFQLFTESVIVALIGGAFGVVVAYWGIDALRASNPAEAAKYVAAWPRLGIDPQVLMFTLGISLLSSVLFGLAPALQASRSDFVTAIKGGSGMRLSGSRLRSMLVVAQVALSFMLLVSAGLLLRSFMELVKTDAGFNADNVLTMRLALPLAKYREPQQRERFFAELVRRVQNVSGIESAAAISHLPLSGSNVSNPFLIEGQPVPSPGNEVVGRYRVCTPEVFKTLGIRVLQGRAFHERDTVDAAPVVIVNETLAKTQWPNGDALGKRMRINGQIDEFPWMQVVGIIQDVKHELIAPATQDYYVPYSRDRRSSMVLVAKTHGDPAAFAGAIRRELWAIDKDQPVFNVKPMADVRAMSIAVYSFSSAILGIFAVVAVALAAVGIYGVLAFTVLQRTREIGIRIALGARAADVLRMIVRNGMAMVLVGVAVGLAGAWAMTRFLKSLLFNVSSTDTVTLAAVSLGLLVVALLACFVPARRASKVDPLAALRHE